jgi:YVTN family beta-propeller protein
MLLRDSSISSGSSGPGPARTRRRALIAGSAAVILAAGTAAVLIAAPASHPAAKHQVAAGASGAKPAHLAVSTCSGPAGAAYVALPGYQAFDAIDTANCEITQSYNVDDPQVPGDSGDYNYAGTDEAVAIHGDTLYFAVTGENQVAIINAATLNPKDYSPAETIIQVGFNPGDLAVTPDGSQLWVADTGPQTGPSSPTAISVISTATDKVTATLRLPVAPAQIAFSPSGATAYVTTADGLWIFNTATARVTDVIRGLGDPHGVAVSPDGSTVYVTNTEAAKVELINAATDKITGTIGVGQLPWQVAISSDGKTVYVADPDSNQVSVISASSDTVTSSISIPGDPDTVGLTPDGSQLWVGGLTSGIITVLDTSNHSVVGEINVGNDGANSGDGNEPTSIVLTTTPTPTGS